MTVSVIIPTFNAKHMLEKNLPVVLAAIRPFDELIIVDDASTDATRTWLLHTYELETEASIVKDVESFSATYKKRKIKVLLNQENQRFASSCNRGALSASGDILVLLNNDVIPHQDFLAPLLTHFEDAKVFAVGCKEIATANGGKESGRAGGRFQRGFLVHWREEDQDQTTTLWAAGGSAAFRRSMWLELGGFDTDFKPAYWEDIDLSFRARARGWKVEFEPRSVVDHNHETTHKSVFGEERMEIMAYKNAILFMWKNTAGIELLKHFFWLPYHMLITNQRSKGRFMQGFMAALRTKLKSET